MAIIAPEQQGFDLGRSRIQPADTYAPVKPVYDDSNAQALASSLGKLGVKFNQMDTDQANEDMKQKQLYVDKVYNTMNDKATDADINNIASPLHPKVRAAVQEAYGERIGEQWVQSQLETPPDGYDSSPEATKSWLDGVRKQAYEKFSGQPFLGGGALKSVDQYITRREAGENAQRTKAWDGELQNNLDNRFRSMGSNGEINTAAAPSPEKAKAIVSAANELGISANDLALVMSYESGFRTDIKGGKGGKYLGLIQFGPTEQRQYGVHAGQSFEEQMKSVVAFLKDRDLKPGMGLLQLYKTINGGNPYVSSSASDGNGTIAQHVARMQAAHQRRSMAFLGAVGASPDGNKKVAEADTGTKSDASPAPSTTSSEAPKDDGEEGAVPSHDSPIEDVPLPPERPAEFGGAEPETTASVKPPEAPAEEPPPNRHTPMTAKTGGDLQAPEDLKELPADDQTWVMQQRQSFHLIDEEFQAKSWFDKKRIRDSAAESFVYNALRDRDARWLKVLPPELLTNDIRTKFMQTEESVDRMKRADAAEARRQAEEARKEAKLAAEKEMNEALITGKPVTPDDLIRWNKIDPDIVKGWNERRKAVSEGMLDPQAEREKTNTAITDMTKRATAGEDVSNYNLDLIQDPAMRQEAMQKREDLVKTGGELAHPYYKRWDDDAKSIYGNLDPVTGFVAIKDGRMPKIQSAFEENLQDEALDFIKANGKPPTTRKERREIYERALEATKKDFPPMAGSIGNPTPETPKSTAPAAPAAPAPQKRTDTFGFGGGVKK